jgi:hypothetical protein
MGRGVRFALFTTMALAAGCVPADFLHLDSSSPGAAAVPTSPFTTPGGVPIKSISNSAPQAVPETLLLVDKVGHHLLAANPSIGIKPQFVTITVAEPEVFHQGTSHLYITDGMVKMCHTENQLAAVLSMEIARMVAENEVLASPETHNPEKRPPIVVPMGNAGQFTGIEQLDQVEVATLDCDRRRPSKRFVPPDPEALARKYLMCAKIDSGELDSIKPLLDQAEQNYVTEAMLTGQNNTTMHWQPK